MTAPAALATALHAHADGSPHLQAATTLLATGPWLCRADFTTTCVTTTSLLDHPPMAFIDWAGAVTALNTGDLPSSGGEQRMLRLAASLAAGIPVDLRDALTGIDDHNVQLLLDAIAHASGRWPTPETPV